MRSKLHNTNLFDNEQGLIISFSSEDPNYATSNIEESDLVRCIKKYYEGNSLGFGIEMDQPNRDKKWYNLKTDSGEYLGSVLIEPQQGTTINYGVYGSHYIVIFKPRELKGKNHTNPRVRNNFRNYMKNRF
ncbi:MAG: hypothetical protein Q8Q35_03245 [Nanoarchaeota archaeon]|nr:hypothetical protein [Nanoarchaeota archaeon]